MGPEERIYEHSSHYPRRRLVSSLPPQLSSLAVRITRDQGSVWLNPGDLLGKLRLPPLSENCDLHTTMGPSGSHFKCALLNLAMNIISRVIHTASDDSCDTRWWPETCTMRAKYEHAQLISLLLHVGLPYRRPKVDNGRSSKGTRA